MFFINPNFISSTESHCKKLTLNLSLKKTSELKKILLRTTTFCVYKKNHKNWIRIKKNLVKIYLGLKIKDNNIDIPFKKIEQCQVYHSQNFVYKTA